MIPNLDGLVGAARGDVLAVGPLSECVDRFRVPGEGLHALSGFGIPNPDGLVVAAGGYVLAIRTVSNRPDQTVVSDKNRTNRVQAVSGFGIPNLDGPLQSLHVVGRDVLAIWAVSN